MKGKLIGIGVGPGDPELMTLKAVRAIEQADVIAVPVKCQGEKSVAFEIVKGACSIKDQTILPVIFSMSCVHSGIAQEGLYSAAQIFVI